jgi:hypothetical protein
MMNLLLNAPLAKPMPTLWRTMWTKYSYVCTSCDSLIEVTTKAKPVIDPACICNPSTYVVRTALEPERLKPVTSITSRKVVKINTNPYN